MAGKARLKHGLLNASIDLVLARMTHTRGLDEMLRHDFLTDCATEYRRALVAAGNKAAPPVKSLVNRIPQSCARRVNASSEWRYGKRNATVLVPHPDDPDEKVSVPRTILLIKRIPHWTPSLPAQVG